MAAISGYELSRCWFDFSFENPEKISPEHTAIFFFAIEHCNRLGWKEKFGFPTQMVIDAIGIKKAHTYIKYFNDLVDWGFFILVQKSKNQHSANIISFNSAMPKNGKALDKAIARHTAKHLQSTRQSTWQSTGPINKLVNNITSKPLNLETGNYFFDQKIEEEKKELFPIEDCVKISLYDERWVRANDATEIELLDFNKKLEREGIYHYNPLEYKTYFSRWKSKGKKDDIRFNNGNNNSDLAAEGRRIKEAEAEKQLNELNGLFKKQKAS